MQSHRRKLLLSGIFILPFVFFIVSYSLFFPFVTGKAIAFRFIVEALFALWVYDIFYSKDYRPHLSSFSVSCLIFLGIIFITNILGENPEKSFWSSFERMDGFISLLHLALYFLLSSTILKREKLWTRYFETLLVAATGIAVAAILQGHGIFFVDGSIERVNAVLGNSAYLAGYLLLHIFLIPIVFFREKNSFVKKLLLVASPILLYALYLTGTRGAYVALVLTLVSVSSLFLLTKNTRDIVRRISVAILIAVFLLVSTIVYLQTAESSIENPRLARIASFSISEKTFQSRLLIWKEALQGFQDKPLLGWGQENFSLVFHAFYDPRLTENEPWFDRAHNMYLEWLVAGGIFGLISYLAIFFFLFLRLLFVEQKFFYKIKRYFFSGPSDISTEESYALCAIILSYLIYSFFVFDSLPVLFVLVTIFAYIHSQSADLLSYKQKIILKKLSKYMQPRDMRGIGTFLLSVFIFTTYFVSIKPLLAAYYLSAANERDSSTLRDSVANYRRALSLNTFANYEIREQLIRTSASVRKTEANNQTATNELIEFSLRETKLHGELNKEDPRAQAFAGLYYARLGELTLAEKHFESALELSSRRKPMFYMELIPLAIKKENYARSLLLSEELFALLPQYEEAHYLRALTHVYAGKTEIALALREDLPYERANDNEFVTAYIKKGYYEDAESILLRRITLDPEDKDSRVRLAALFVEMEEHEKAIDEINKIVVFDPTFSDEAARIVDEIRAAIP